MNEFEETPEIRHSLKGASLDSLEPRRCRKGPRGRYCAQWEGHSGSCPLWPRWWVKLGWWLKHRTWL